MILTATLRKRGQLTLPKALREQLKLRGGDTVKFYIQEDGVTLRRIRPFLEYKGSIHVDGPQDFEAVREYALEQPAREIATGGAV